MNVFQLKAIILDKPRDDGICRTWAHDLGVFTSVENAEEMMRRCRELTRSKYWAGGWGDWPDFPLFDFIDPWAFEVRERILDDLAPHGRFGVMSAFRSVRTYFADGTLNAASDLDDTGEKGLFGRDAATIRFKRGDFVSVLDGGFVYPAIVESKPSLDDIRHRGLDDDTYLEEYPYFGDTYTVCTHTSHSDSEDCYAPKPFTPYVFPLANPLTNDVRKELEHMFNRPF